MTQHNGTEEEHRAYATQLVTSIAFPMTMQAAIDLGVLEIIAKEGPDAKLSPSEIAKRIPCKNPNAPAMLHRILNLLASFSVLTFENERYGLAPVAKYFAKDEQGASFAPLMALLHDKVFVASWYHLKDSVVEGGVAFDRENGTNAFDYQGVDPRFNDVFNNAMIYHTKTVMKELLQAYRGFHENMERMTLVDVGGGLGATLNIIISMFPKIKGINFDLPHVICHAPPYPGVEHVEGDMFESVPKADAIFMKWILHDWSDEHCLKLLKNCFKATPQNGKVIVVEGVIPDVPDNKLTDMKSIYQLDLIMLTVNPGGKERTRKQFHDLAVKAGFAGIKMECTAFSYWIMEIYK